MPLDEVEQLTEHCSVFCCVVLKSESDQPAARFHGGFPVARQDAGSAGHALLGPMNTMKAKWRVFSTRMIESFGPVNEL